MRLTSIKYSSCLRDFIISRNMTALGLASLPAKKIIDEFQGEISVSSELSKGTTFKINVPENIIDTPYTKL